MEMFGKSDVRDLFERAEECGFEGVPHDYATTLNKWHGTRGTDAWNGGSAGSFPVRIAWTT
jgi:hypothetical protein